MNPDMPLELIDTVPELSRKHFEEGLKFARSSVTKHVFYLNLSFLLDFTYI